MKDLIPTERIEKCILLLRGQKVILDKDLAALYGVSTKNLNKAVSRNLDRFPDDFMFQLDLQEVVNLKFQIGTSSWGGTRKLPRAFTDPHPNPASVSTPPLLLHDITDGE